MTEQVARNIHALSMSPLLLDGLLSAVVDQILVFGREGTILYANQSALKALDTTAEKIIGHHWASVDMPIDYFEPIKQNLPYVINQNMAVKKEVARLIAGEQQFFEYIITPIEAESLSDQLAVIQIRDITAHKRMIDAVHSTETRFGITLDNAPIGMAMLDVSGVFFTANKKLCEMLACSEKDLMGKNIRQLIVADDLDDLLIMIECMLDARQRSFQQNLRLLDSHNEPFWCQMTVTMVRNTTGQPHYFIVQLIDIRLQKELEILLAREQRYSDALLNQLPTAALVVDQSLQLKHWNNKLNLLLDYSDNELEQMNLSALLNLDEPERLHEIVSVGGMLDSVSLSDKAANRIECFLTCSRLPHEVDSLVIVQIFAGVQNQD